MSRIQITGDSTIDLSPELLAKYNVRLAPLYVTMGEESFQDGVTVSPEDIYAYVERTGALPKTAAVSVQDYITLFREAREKSDAVIHFNISAEFSSAYQNACIAAKEVDGVYPVDTRNLSTGSGLLVLEACELAEQGLSAPEIVEEVQRLVPRVEASFIIKRLDYLSKGGRCSSLLALGANLLKLRPMILVQEGRMTVGKKFRGDYDDCVRQYVESKLKNRDDIRSRRVFITHTKCEESTLKAARKALADCQRFEEVLETTAGCTITTHCGENTLGVLFIRE